jgi:hypothetical protein
MGRATRGTCGVSSFSFWEERMRYLLEAMQCIPGPPGLLSMAPSPFVRWGKN